MDRMETEKVIKNYFTNLKKPVPVDTMAAELANLLDDEIRPGDEVIYKVEGLRGIVLADACDYPFMRDAMDLLMYIPEDCCGYWIPKNTIVRKTGIHIDLSDLTKYIKENS